MLGASLCVQQLKEMTMLPRLFSSILFVAILFMATACARSSGLLKPGDRIGDMVVVKATPDAYRVYDH
jgi:hypothetical protein